MPNNSTQSTDHQTIFEFTEFFLGRTRAWGIFEDRFGRLRRRISVEMHGSWREQIFVLEELFAYDTGATEKRTWLVEPLGTGRFKATCPDCVGVALGRCDSDSIVMSYQFRLALSTRVIVVRFDDRIYRTGDGIAINRATMSKWGVKLGELSLFFHRVAEQDQESGTVVQA
ncbi:MAG: DUF3833 family protein [Hyphomicrobiaceae bacterium]|nr:DUF3833 family protein [Hyphomicrobiaceae bacterium]